MACLSSEPAESDNVNDIISIALSVLMDYGFDEATRIGRLARWIVYTLDAEFQERQQGNVSSLIVEDPTLAVWQYGDTIAVRVGPSFPRSLTMVQARQLATALLVCVERAEAL